MLAALLVVASAGTASAQRERGEDESAALVEEGRRALKDGELDDAARALDQAIALNPRRIEAYVLRAAIHLSRKQYADGIALTRRARGFAPRSNDVLGMLGMLLMLDGKTREGVPLLEQVVERRPRRYDAQGILGRHYAARGRWQRAIAALTAYLQARPGQLAGSDPIYRIELANAYLRSGQPTQARRLFARTLRQRPDDVRARLGMAWATAAVDCRRARPMLARLGELAERHPQVWLVEGQCSLAAGDPAAAIQLGRRYVASATRSKAAGHALTGEAHLVQNDLTAARAELATARKLEPRHRRWAVRLAHVSRRAGDARAARAELDRIGPPAEPEIDPAWWAELGDALIASGDAPAAVVRLTPIASRVPRDPAIRTVLGDALYRTGDADEAVKWLAEAERIRSTPRSRGLYARALESVAVERIKAGELAGAEAALVRADRANPSPSIGRNLGVVRLALRRPKQAAEPLERSAQAEPDPITWMLLARARAGSGDAVAARAAYQRAAAAARDDAAMEVALDAASFELRSGEPAAAVVALERSGGGEASDDALAARFRRAQVVAQHAAGLAALRSGAAGRAVKHLEAAAALASGRRARAIRCDLALAAVATGERAAALRRLRQVDDGPCPFPAPASTQAVPILIAFTEGLSARRAGAALERLEALDRKASGAAKQLLATATRVIAINAAAQAYRRGQLRQARRYLAQARKVQVDAAGDELAHNQAVLDVADGRINTARAALEKLTPRLPEALVNLGVAYERQGEPEKALEAWQRARKSGVRFAPLATWIAAKERIYGDGTGGEQ